MNLDEALSEAATWRNTWPLDKTDHVDRMALALIALAAAVEQRRAAERRVRALYATRQQGETIFDHYLMPAEVLQALDQEVR